MELPRCPGAGQQAHDQAEIVAGDVDQVALVDVLPPTQPAPSHAATAEHRGEAAFDDPGAQTQGGARDAGKQPDAVVDHRAAGGVVAMPAQEAVALRRGDAGLPRAAVERLQRLAGMVALVGDQFGRRRRARRCLDRVEMPRGARQRARQGGGVAAIGGVHLGRDHRAGVEVDRVLRLVRQPRAAVLQPGDARGRIGRACPLGIGELVALAGVALAGAIQPDQAVGVSMPLSRAMRVSISR